MLLDESEAEDSGTTIPGSLHFSLLLRGEHVTGTKNTVVLSLSVVESVRLVRGHEELKKRENTH